MVKLRAVFGPTLDAVIGISVIVTLIAGGRMVLDGQVSIGQFVAFNSYIDMLVWPMIAAGDCINTFSQAAAAWGRIRTIFEEKPDIVDMGATGKCNRKMMVLLINCKYMVIYSLATSLSHTLTAPSRCFQT